MTTDNQPEISAEARNTAANYANPEVRSAFERSYQDVINSATAALQEQIAALTRERDELKLRLAGMKSENVLAITERDAALAKVAELEREKAVRNTNFDYVANERDQLRAELYESKGKMADAHRWHAIWEGRERELIEAIQELKRIHGKVSGFRVTKIIDEALAAHAKPKP